MYVCMYLCMYVGVCVYDNDDIDYDGDDDDALYTVEEQTVG